MELLFVTLMVSLLIFIAAWFLYRKTKRYIEDQEMEKQHWRSVQDDTVYTPVRVHSHRMNPRINHGVSSQAVTAPTPPTHTTDTNSVIAVAVMTAALSDSSCDSSCD